MDILQFIADNSEDPIRWDQLKKTLDQNSRKIAASANQIIMPALERLDPEMHTLGLIYILHAKMTSAKPDQAFLVGTERLLQRLNGMQARRCPDKLSALVHRYTETCLEGRLFNRAITALRAGIVRFRPSADHLTPLHADYLCICLKAMNYKAAEQLLKDKILDIDPPSTAVTPKDMLLYHYYGGMVYVGLKKFKEALQFFDTGMQIPAIATSAIMVEIYKKLVLVSLLVHGKFRGVSKHATRNVTRRMDNLCSHYVDFAKAFAKGDVRKMEAAVADHTQKFQEDNNLGLIKQCVSALKRRNIKKLTDTYITLSLSDIARQANLDSEKEAESEILHMIAEGEICAVISQKDGMVTFEEDVHSFTSPAAGSVLENGISRSVQLAHRIKTMDDRIALSDKFIARLHGIKEDIAFGGDFGSDAGPLSHRSPISAGSRSRLARMFDFTHRP